MLKNYLIFINAQHNLQLFAPYGNTSELNVNQISSISVYLKRPRVAIVAPSYSFKQEREGLYVTVVHFVVLKGSGTYFITRLSTNRQSERIIRKSCKLCLSVWSNPGKDNG
jgi:hypothetical protein